MHGFATAWFWHRRSSGTHRSVGERPNPAVECFRNGAPIHRRTKSGRRNENVAQAPFAKIGFTVDLLGEAVVSEADADEYAARYLDLLENLARETKTGPTRWAKIPSSFQL